MARGTKTTETRKHVQVCWWAVRIILLSSWSHMPGCPMVRIAHRSKSDTANFCTDMLNIASHYNLLQWVYKFIGSWVNCYVFHQRIDLFAISLGKSAALCVIPSKVLHITSKHDYWELLLKLDAEMWSQSCILTLYFRLEPELSPKIHARLKIYLKLELGLRVKFVN